MNQIDNLLANSFQSLSYEDKLKIKVYLCSLDKHYTTSWKLQIQQWVVWKESVAKCKHCKAITSLLFSREGVWSKSGFKGLYSKLKRINIQHHEPEKFEYIGHAVNPACLLPHSKQLETWKSQTLMSSRQQGTLEKKTSSDWENTFLNGHSTRNSKLWTRASF